MKYQVSVSNLGLEYRVSGFFRSQASLDSPYRRSTCSSSWTPARPYTTRSSSSVSLHWTCSRAFPRVRPQTRCVWASSNSRTNRVSCIRCAKRWNAPNCCTRCAQLNSREGGKNKIIWIDLKFVLFKFLALT